MVNTVISTFAGCGGSSLGYKLAGFKEVLAIDWDDTCEQTFKLNFPNVPFWNKDIKEISTDEILKFTNLKKGELDILDGSPPCQGFSTAGARKVLDPRNDLFLDFINLIKGLSPKIFVMENVSGMVKGTMKGRFKEIIKDLKKLDYKVKCKLLNAKYYNVAQSRQRLFFIGVRNDLNKEPIFPVPNNKILTVGKVLNNIHNSSKEIKNAYITNPKIRNAFYRIKKGGKGNIFDNRPNSYFNICKLIESKPSNTITKTRGILHFIEQRYLTINEVKTICSFPNDFILIGSNNQQWGQLGNSVMPNQMKAIAETLKKEILHTASG